MSRRGDKAAPDGARSVLKRRRRKAHGRRWIAPKDVATGIRSQLVPIAIGNGWRPMEQRRARKGEHRLGEFSFERAKTGRVEHIGFDYRYGDKPDVWIMFSLRLDEGSAGPAFWTGNCANYSNYRKPL